MKCSSTHYCKHLIINDDLCTKYSDEALTRLCCADYVPFNSSKTQDTSNDLVLSLEGKLKIKLIEIVGLEKRNKELGLEKLSEVIKSAELVKQMTALNKEIQELKFEVQKLKSKPSSALDLYET